MTDAGSAKLCESETIEVFPIRLTKDQLRTLPPDDRNLLLLASHAVNQITVLRRVLIFSLNYESKTSSLENMLSAAQSQMLLRHVLAALSEAWVMLNWPVHHRLIGRDYAIDMDPEGKAAHERLKKHFGASPLLQSLRNEVIYHYPDATTLNKAFEDAPDGEDWSWYPSDTINNSFYLGTDLVIMTAILQKTGEADTLKAFEKITGLVVPLSNDMTDMFLYVMRAIVSRHFDPALLNFRPGAGVAVHNVPHLYKVSFPFFTVRDEP